MKSFRVLSATTNPETGFIEVVKEITADDNSTSLNLHTFHPEALEWRAAELGLSNPDEVIDGILHEPFFDEDIQSFQLSAEDAQTKFRATLAATKARVANGSLRNPVAIKAQLRSAGVAQRYIDAVDNDPLQVIRGACPFDPEVITAKREHTDKVRAAAALAKERAPEAPPTHSQRAAALRARQQAAVGGPRAPEPPVAEVTLPPVVLNGKRKREAGQEK